jgi:hypothetical protein
MRVVGALERRGGFVRLDPEFAIILRTILGPPKSTKRIKRPIIQSMEILIRL